MDIRKLSRAEHENTRSLYEQVFFEDEERFVKYYYENRAAKNEIYVVEENGDLCSMLHLNPCTICFGTKCREISYIVAVATKEECRHRGYMRGLLETALADLYEKKDPFVFLMPASEKIYLPFGFGSAWSWRWEEEVLLGEELDRYGGQGGDRGQEGLLTAAELPHSMDAEQCTEAVLQELSDGVNRELKKRFQLFVWRSPEYYRDLSAQQRASRGGLEILFEDEMPVSARCRSKESFPPMMARIVDLEQFIAEIKVKKEQRFLWEVVDPILPGNCGVYEILLNARENRIQRVEPKEGGPVPEKVDISRIPELLGVNNPWRQAMICEVV